MDSIDSPLEVLAHKVFPSGAQLTKLKADGHVVYVRENVENGVQILELSAPEAVWTKLAAVVALEDHLHRLVKPNPDFTAEWAETELARSA